MRREYVVKLLVLPLVVSLSACSMQTPEPKVQKKRVNISNVKSNHLKKTSALHSFPSTPVVRKVHKPLPLAKTYPIVTRKMAPIVRRYQPVEREFANYENVVEEYDYESIRQAQRRAQSESIIPIESCISYEPVTREFNNYEEAVEERFDPSFRVEVEAPSRVYSEPYLAPPIEVASNPIQGCRHYSSRYSHVKDVERKAKDLLGIKYVWGATGPYTYDCSGFTQKVYRQAGIKIPRVSRDQAKVGEYISFNNLQKGDMVFFDTHKKKTGKVTHVGIYLGNGNFIHASSAAKKVVIFNFNKKNFYKKRFLWGRRIIQNSAHLASL